jgi:hypothetical protein
VNQYRFRRPAKQGDSGRRATRLSFARGPDRNLPFQKVITPGGGSRSSQDPANTSVEGNRPIDGGS